MRCRTALEVQLSVICVQLLEAEFEEAVADLRYDVIVFSCIFLLLTFKRNCSIYVCGQTLLLALELRDSAKRSISSRLSSIILPDTVSEPQEEHVVLLSS